MRGWGQTWRSIASVFIAYALVVALFFFEAGLLNRLFDISESARSWLKDIIGALIGDEAESLFRGFVSEGTVFITLMILLARVVILSFSLWVGSLIVTSLFGSPETR